MKRQEDVLDDLIHMSKKVFPKENHQIEEKARILYDGYCKLEAGKPKEITMHTQRMDALNLLQLFAIRMI